MNFKTAIKIHSLLWIYVVATAISLGLVAWTSLRTLQGTSTQEVSVEIPDTGFGTVQFNTNPFLPLPIGNVMMLNFVLTNSRNAMADLGPALSFAYRNKGDETPIGLGQADLVERSINYQVGMCLLPYLDLLCRYRTNKPMLFPNPHYYISEAAKSGLFQCIETA